MSDGVPALSLARYVDLLAGVPLPTREQKENFVEYVSHAHSWYKHLPLCPPGVPFHFFIDKYAGWDRTTFSDGTWTFEERTEDGFHYSQIPTKSYRESFGHLGFSSEAGSTVLLIGQWPMVVPRDQTAGVPDYDSLMCGLPAEIMGAGMARLTGVIHTLSAAGSGEHATMEPRKRPLPTYPSSDRYISCADAVLYERLAPERRRQHDEIIKAIDRVCEIIQQARK
jgi:hypothetical protein